MHIEVLLSLLMRRHLVEAYMHVLVEDLERVPVIASRPTCRLALL